MPEVTSTQPTKEPRAPEAPHWVVSTLMPRAAAAFVDGLIIFALWLAGALAYVAGRSVLVGLGVDSLPELGALDVHVGIYATGALYLGLTEGRRGPRNGQTVGKQLAGIRTVQARGGLPTGYGRSWLRALWVAWFLPLGFPLFGLIERAELEWVAEDTALVVIWAITLAIFTGAISGSRRIYHDRLLGTAVVQASIVASGEPEPRSDQPALVPLAIVELPRSAQTMFTAGVWVVVIPYFTFVDRV